MAVSKDPRDDLLLDRDGDPLADMKVQTAERFYLHSFVTSTLQTRETGDILRIYDGRLRLAIATYAPGTWLSFEVLRFYRQGDDPPEAET